MPNFEATEKGCFLLFSVASKQCAQPLPLVGEVSHTLKPAMSGFLIEGAQRAEPLPLPRWTFSAASKFRLFNLFKKNYNYIINFFYNKRTPLLLIKSCPSLL
jgi:hypothetical protein